MITAQQWHDELLALMNRPPAFAYCQASVEDIRRIQADALKEAAECAGLYSTAASEAIAHIADRLDRRAK